MGCSFLIRIKNVLLKKRIVVLLFFDFASTCICKSSERRTKNLKVLLIGFQTTKVLFVFDVQKMKHSDNKFI